MGAKVATAELSLKEWLDEIKLPQFYEAIVDQGCADMAFLLSCDDSEVADICDDVEMKKMQKSRFLKALTERKDTRKMFHKSCRF